MSDELKEVLTQFGRRVVDRPDQLRAALSDVIGARSVEREAEITAIVAASERGIAAAIRDSDPEVPATADQIKGWFDDLTAHGIQLRDAAMATHSWAIAFDAMATARLTTEVTEGALSEALASGAPTGTARTGTGAGDVTVHVATPAPVVPVADGGGGVPPVSPPSTTGSAIGGLVDRLDAALPERARSVVGRSWIPAIAGGAVLILALGITIPVAASNFTPAEPVGQPVIDGKVETSLDVGDVDQLLIGYRQLEKALETSTGYFGPGPFTTDDLTQAWIKKASDGCAPQLSLFPGEDDEAGPVLGTQAYDDDITIYSLSRAFATAEAARDAHDALQVDGCAKFSLSVKGGKIPVTSARIDEFEGTTAQGVEWIGFHDRTVAHGTVILNYDRMCAVADILVVCHIAVGERATLTGKTDLISAAEALLNDLETYIPGTAGTSS